MRICFVGHEFQRRTGSSAFFQDILRTIGDVTDLYADPDGGPAANDRLVRALVNSRFDRYIFWQSETLAERLLPLELGPFFLVPMYDSIAHRDQRYWLKFVKHRILSFSRAHHEALQRLGCASAYFQFFPDPGPDPHRPIDPSALDAFFWQRRSDGPITTQSVAGICRQLGIGRLHVHDAPDFPDRHDPAEPSDEEALILSRSRWFDRRADYEATAASPLFFFAPRPLEGIGMATLEAMARSQIVVAPDLPTANEYVSHGHSGLLYDINDFGQMSWFPSLGPDLLRAMSDAARRKIVQGRRTWLKDVERLKSVIADDGARWVTSDYSAHFGRAIRRAAHERAKRAG